MPAHILDEDQGTHALLMLRISLIGVTELDADESLTPEELAEARALASTAVADHVRLLDLYLTASSTSRVDDVPWIMDLVHRGTPWNARLSNEIGSVLMLHRPEAPSTTCVSLDLDAPLDDDIRDRWHRIDKVARPSRDLGISTSNMELLMAGRRSRS